MKRAEALIPTKQTVQTIYRNSINGTLQALINDAVVLPSKMLCMREWL
jgi:hypothetical protein